MLKHILAVAVVLTALVSAPASAQTDVSGTWNAVVELDIGSGEPTFVFTQDGDKITGTYEGTFGSAPLTGTVTGDTIEFTFGAEGVGSATYTGTISGDAMKGTCDYGEAGGGTWDARKAG